MARLVRALMVALAGVGALAIAVFAWLLASGASARPEPGRIETIVARRVRTLAIPREIRNRTNPVPLTATVSVELPTAAPLGVVELTVGTGFGWVTLAT